MIEQKIAELRELFKQRDEIDAKIANLLEGGALPDNKPLPVAPARRKGRKPRVDILERKKPGRKPRSEGKGARYRCQDCEDEFVSDKEKLDVVCPTCGSIHVK